MFNAKALSGHLHTKVGCYTADYSSFLEQQKRRPINCSFDNSALRDRMLLFWHWRKEAKGENVFVIQ